MNARTINVMQVSPFWDEDITVQIGYKDEDGDFVMESCNHAGAKLEDVFVEYLSFDPHYGNYLPDEDGTIKAYVCKCGAQSPDGVKWDE